MDDGRSAFASVAARLANQRRGAGLAARLAAYALIWWALSGGEAGSWLWGLPAVVAAALFNPLPHAPRWRWRVGGFLRFVPLFLWFSLWGGVDVAKRALHPGRPPRPALVCYPWRLGPGPARIFLSNTINLVPGTLSVRIEERALTIHVLHDPETAVHSVRRLERSIAGLVGVPGGDHDD